MNEEHFDLVKGSLSRMKRAAYPEKRPEPTQEEIDELFAERITPETNLPPMQPLFQMFDVPCFYRGELVADCGKAKSGKTFFLSIIMGRSLTPCPSPTGEGSNHSQSDPFPCLQRARDQPLRVLWIDTEQSQQSTQEILRDRIIPLAELCPKGTNEIKDISVISEISVCDKTILCARISSPLICEDWGSRSAAKWWTSRYAPSSPT